MLAKPVGTLGDIKIATINLYCWLPIIEQSFVCMSACTWSLWRLPLPYDLQQDSANRSLLWLKTFRYSVYTMAVWAQLYDGALCGTGWEHAVCVHRACQQGHQHAVLLVGGPWVRSIQKVCTILLKQHHMSPSHLQFCVMLSQFLQCNLLSVHSRVLVWPYMAWGIWAAADDTTARTWHNLRDTLHDIFDCTCHLLSCLTWVSVLRLAAPAAVSKARSFGTWCPSNDVEHMTS